MFVVFNGPSAVKFLIKELGEVEEGKYFLPSFLPLACRGYPYPKGFKRSI